LLHNPCTVLVMGEHAVGIEQGRVLGVQTRAQGVIQDELQPRTPTVTEQVLEGLHEKVSRGWPIIRRNGINQVPCNRVLQVARVKIHHIIAALWWDLVENIFG
jgi:hypothetical protein